MTVDRKPNDPGELDVVKLKRPLLITDENGFVTQDSDARGTELPVGTQGTIVLLPRAGEPKGYLVEFSDDEGATLAVPWLPRDDFEIVWRLGDSSVQGNATASE